MNESVVIAAGTPHEVTVMITEIVTTGDRTIVKLGFEALRSVEINRSEVQADIRREAMEAARGGRS